MYPVWLSFPWFKVGLGWATALPHTMVWLSSFGKRDQHFHWELLPLYTTLSLYRCIIRSRLLLASVGCLLFVWERASELELASRVRAPQLFPIYEACGYSLCLAFNAHAMHLNTFLQAFNRLGLTQWDGIEEDIAWGHVTSLMGLARPCMDGPILCQSSFTEHSAG